MHSAIGTILSLFNWLNPEISEISWNVYIWGENTDGIFARVVQWTNPIVIKVHTCISHYDQGNEEIITVIYQIGLLGFWKWVLRK